MNDLELLICLAEKRNCRIALLFDPEIEDEKWAIKLYPDMDDDAHFYAYNNDLQAACHLLLDEIKGFKPW